jgi:methylated-DNA-[protein]-cysteine S-methyltransferase
MSPNTRIDPAGDAIRRAAHAEPRLAEAAAERFAARAADDELVDIAYATLDAPVGELLVAGTSRGLVRVSFGADYGEHVLTELAERVSPRILELPARLDDTRRQLDAYFEGKLRRFELPLDWSLAAGGFLGKVQHQIARIPYGETRSYKEMAEDAGSPRAYRAAGSACGSNPIPIVVPCHRVLASGGGLGGYGGGLPAKEYLLRLEGVRE